MATPKKTTSKKAPSTKAKSSSKVTSAKTKTTAKNKTAKSASKAAPVKKTTTASVPPNTVKVSKKTASSWMGWLFAALLGGALIGTYASDAFWMEAFDAEAGMLVVDDKTWMPVGGAPISVVVLNDKDCGTPCNSSASLDSLRASVNPALKVTEIDISSNEGQALINAFDLVSVPQYFFGKDIEELEVEGPEGEEIRFIDNLPPGLLTEKNNLYYIDSAQVGFKPGKFIEKPDFADLDTEPSQGNGPINVVEFTDLQCPYCKRFYDQNKSLIDQLVLDGTITYIVKDFPLSFHTEAYGGIHKAANCALQEGGNDVYFAVKDQIFANQSSFTGIGVPAAEMQVADYASEQGVNIESCLAEDGNVLQSEVAADIAEGAKYGVSGTPTIFVGTQILPGAVGPAALSAAVNAELGN
jgi:protein-disulfide isomerase